MKGGKGRLGRAEEHELLLWSNRDSLDLGRHGGYTGIRICWNVSNAAKSGISFVFVLFCFYKGNHLVEGSLTISEGQYIITVVGSRQAWLCSGSWEFTTWSSGSRQERERERLGLVQAFETSKATPSDTPTPKGYISSFLSSLSSGDHALIHIIQRRAFAFKPPHSTHALIRRHAFLKLEILDLVSRPQKEYISKLSLSQ